MLTKPVAQALRDDMAKAIDAGKFALNEGQTIEDVIEYIRDGIKQHTFEPGITFDEFYLKLIGGAPSAGASSGDDAAVAEEETTGPKDTVDIGDLYSWLDLYKKAKRKIEESKEVAETAKKKITARLEEVADTTTGKAITASIEGKPVAAWIWVNATRFNMDKFKAEHPDLHEQYTVPNPHRRFDLK
jgi:predicted phage-related endonuclease